jgi:hypothetical protein
MLMVFMIILFSYMHIGKKNRIKMVFSRDKKT